MAQEPTGWFGVTWRDVAVVMAGVAIFVALLFFDDSACSLRVRVSDSTTTTEAVSP